MSARRTPAGWSSVERWLGAAVLAVGRTVTRTAAVLPQVVRRASGLEDPSPEAVVASVVRGITTLAPATMGPITGAFFEVFGVVTVLALAMSTVSFDAEDADVFGDVLAGVLTLAAQRGLSGSRNVPLWRVVLGLAPLDRSFVRSQAEALPRWIAAAVPRGAAGYALGDVTRCLRPLHVAGAIGDAWKSMGEAARFVDATRALAREHLVTERGIDEAETIVWSASHLAVRITTAGSDGLRMPLVSDRGWRVPASDTTALRGRPPPPTDGYGLAHVTA